MHLGVLSGLILALAGNFMGGSPAHTSGTAYQTTIQHSAAIYSILAQATTTATVSTGITSTTIPATSTVQAASTVTSTAVVTGSSAITPTLPPATAVPLPTVGPQSNLQINPFDWTFLTGYPTEPKIGPFAIAFLVIMLALIGGGIYFLRVRAPQWKSTNPVLYKAVNRFATPAIWIGAIGILLLILRIIPIDFFNLRFWLYLDFLALLGLAGWIYYWYRTSYPKEIAKFTKTQKARQYMPGGSGKIASRSTPVATPQGRTANAPKTTTPQAKPGTTTTPTQPKSGTTPRPAQQQSNKNRKRK